MRSSPEYVVRRVSLVLSVARRVQGKPYKAIADETGLAVNTVRNVLSGTRDVKLGSAERVAKSLGVNLSEALREGAGNAEGTCDNRSVSDAWDVRVLLRKSDFSEREG